MAPERLFWYDKCMSNPTAQQTSWLFRFLSVVFFLSAAVCSQQTLRAEEPPALNPFGARQEDRNDAVPGYVEMSDGTIYAGRIYLTRDKRLKLFDQTLERQREIPLRAIKQIECRVVREWMEKEWRFKETTSDEKYYSGREYPAREYVHTVTLQDGRTLTGPLAEIVYVQTAEQSPGESRYRAEDAEPQRVMLHKRDKGPVGTDLKSLRYVRLIKLGDDAQAEGRKKAAERQAKEKR